MNQDFSNYIAAIIREGSISDAARSLGISQPALSARIKKIEDDYGITLFKRNHRPPVLTEEGRRYMEFISRVELLDRGFRRYISDTHDLTTGEVRVGGTHLYTQYFLPDAVAHFHDLYPGVRIRVVNDNIPALSNMVAKGDLDLYISSPGKRISGMKYEALSKTRLYFCVPSDHPVNSEFKGKAILPAEFQNPDLRKKSIHPDALSGCTFILLDESQYMGQELRELFRKYHIVPGNFVYTDQAMTAYAMSVAGVGISLMFDRTIEQIEMSPAPCYYTLDDEILIGELCIAYTARKDLSLAAKKFVSCMQKSFSKNPLC